MSSPFRVVGAQIGIIKGVHDQFIRPDTVSASEDNIDTLFKRTRGFSSINALSVNKSNITSITNSASVRAKIEGRWSDTRTHGVLIVDKIDGKYPERFMLGFFIPAKAIYNGMVDPTATLTLNSCHRTELHTKRLKQVQTDIVQRICNSDNNSIIPNRISDRLHATPSADGNTTTFTTGDTVVRGRTNLGDSSNLLADDSLATTLHALDNTARTIGVRSLELQRKEEVSMESICEGAQNFVQEYTPEDNDLINFIMNHGQGSMKYLSISVENLQRTLGHFDFGIVETEAGDVDFTQTSEMNTISGSCAQAVVNQILGLMIRRSITQLRFYASNESGKVEMLCKERWLLPIRTKDVEGLDRDEYLAQLQQTEATIRNEIQTLILPKVMNIGEVEMLVDISMLTTAAVKLSMHSRKHTYTIQSATSSAWSTVNIADSQLATTGLAQRNILRAVLQNVATQSEDHVADDRRHGR